MIAYLDEGINHDAQARALLSGLHINYSFTERLINIHVVIKKFTYRLH